MVHADGSVCQTWDFLKQHGLQGFINIWPRPTAISWKIIACYAAFEAALQLLLPGKMVEGPISPEGNRPVYKVLFTWYCLYQTSMLFFLLFDYNSGRLETNAYATSYIPHSFYMAPEMSFLSVVIAGKWCGSICGDFSYLS